MAFRGGGQERKDRKGGKIRRGQTHFIPCVPPPTMAQGGGIIQAIRPALSFVLPGQDPTPPHVSLTILLACSLPMTLKAQSPEVTILSLSVISPGPEKSVRNTEWSLMGYS
jgi:hypothetical protein